MKKIFFIPFLILVSIITLTSIQSCSTISNLAKNLQNLQFKLDNVNNFKLNGIDVSKISQPSQLSIIDMLSLTNMITKKQLPVDFTLNVSAKNPNGTSGNSSSNSSAITLTKMNWTLLIDDRTTINGVVNQPINVPGAGQSTIIPVGIQLDLMKFFNDKGVDDLVNLALALGGAQGSTTRLKLSVRPTVQTPVGSYQYPSDIMVMSSGYTN